MQINDGNSRAWNILCSAIKNKRPAHGVLFYGEHGTGKKTIADEYAAKLLCTDPDEDKRPCGVCNACKQVKNHMHPDVFYAQKTGKLGVIAAGNAGDEKEGTVRDLRAKLFEYPSAGRAKIIILPDCVAAGSWIQAQNMLLKILEEPPEYGYIIFTAEEKEIFLDTIISRIISLPVSRCTDEQTAEILRDKKIGEADISEAEAVFGGNPGKCFEYINNPEIKEKTNAVKNFFKSIEFNKEYDALKYLNIFVKDRQTLAEGCVMIENTARDAVTAAECGEVKYRLGVSSRIAKNLAGTQSTEKLYRIYNAAKQTEKYIAANMRPSLAVTAMCAEIFR